MAEEGQPLMPPAPPGVTDELRGADEAPPAPEESGSVEARGGGSPGGAPDGAETEENDIDKVYRFRDGIMKGAEALGVETKGELLDLFLNRSVSCGSPEAPARVVRRSHFQELLVELGLDPEESGVAWITSHFSVADCGPLEDGEEVDPTDPPVDVVGLLDYLQLTPEAEEQTILANLHDKLCDGANRAGITTKEELCAFLIHAGARQRRRRGRCCCVSQGGPRSRSQKTASENASSEVNAPVA